MPSAPGVSGIYAIRNGDRVYVGSSYDILRRWGQHRSRLRSGRHGNPYLQNAWNRYGESSFEFVVLEECAVEHLIEREQYHLDRHPDRYNIAPVAGSSLGVIRSPESRARMSAAQKGRTVSPEGRANISASKIGNKNGLGHVKSPETRERCGLVNKGRKASPETKAKMSASRMGNTNRKGTTASPETRAKLSAAAKAQWERKRAEKSAAAIGSSLNNRSILSVTDKPAPARRNGPKDYGP